MCTASNLISVLVGVTYAAHFDCMVYRCQWVCKHIATSRRDSRHNVQELKESTVRSVIFANVSAFIRCVELYSVISIYDPYEFQIHLPRKSRCNGVFEQTLFVQFTVIIQQVINRASSTLHIRRILAYTCPNLCPDAGLAFWRHAN